MGKVVVLECTHCQYKEEIFIGNRSQIKEINLDEFIMSIKVKDHIKGLLENGYKIEEFCTNIYVCEECITVYQRGFIKLRSRDGGDIYEVKHNCPKCRKDLEIVQPDNVFSYTCPSCSLMSLTKVSEYNLE